MRLLILISIMLITVPAYSQTNIQVPLKTPPKKDPSKQDIKIVPTFPKTDSTTKQEGLPEQESGTTLAKLPTFQQDKVLADLHAMIGNVENQILSSNPELSNDFKRAKDDFEKLLNNKGGSVPKLILWSLDKDARLIHVYETTGDKTYASAAFQNVRTVTASSSENATVTVDTVNSQGRPKKGFEICYTYAEWADLKNPPYLCFAEPSESSEDLLKNVTYSFWSRDFQDQNKVSGKTPKLIDRNKAFSIGIPPQ